MLNGTNNDTDFNSSNATSLTAVQIAVGSIAIISMFLGVIGNGVTILALVYDKQLRSQVTTWFVINLCACDLLYCGFRLPIGAYRYLDGGDVRITSCRATAFIVYSVLFASRISLIAVTLNRYVLIVFYSWYNKLYSRGSVLAQIAFCWLLPALILSPTLFEVWGRFGWANKAPICILKPDSNGNSSENTLMFPFLILPCLAIVLCYTHILVHVRRHARKVASNDRSLEASNSRKIKRHDVQLTKMMFIICLVFLATALPTRILRATTSATSRSYVLSTTAIALFWAGYWSNFIVYAAMNQRYRAAYLQLFRSCLGQSRGTIATGTASAQDSTEQAALSL